MTGLTTHVLDTALGKPAKGMRIDVVRHEGRGREVIKTVTTNDDGRIDGGPILAGDSFVIGEYELIFHAGDYLRATGAVLPEPPFLDIIPIRFGIADTTAHYHVPLLISPFSYSTYRGKLTMRLAVIADVHGNAAALAAVLADIDAQGITEIVNLGDCFSGPLDAGRTAELLIARDIATVCGNHDRALIDRPFEAMGDWEIPAYKQLSPEQLDWVRSLPFSLVWRDEAYLCHATPQDDNTYWTEALTPDGFFRLKALEEIEVFAEGIAQPLLLCGHSHIARSVLLSDGRLLVNPGSVGCPGYDYDQPWYHKAEAGTPFACYAVLEKTTRGWQPSFRQVRYDHEAMAALSESSGLKDWTSALRTGWVR